MTRWPLAIELLQDARDRDRRREETAALRIYAAVYVQQDRHRDAVDALNEALEIAIAIEDTVVQASLHLRLAESLLALGDAEGAEPHVAPPGQRRALMTTVRLRFRRVTPR